MNSLAVERFEPIAHAVADRLQLQLGPIALSNGRSSDQMIIASDTDRKLDIGMRLVPAKDVSDKRNELCPNDTSGYYTYNGTLQHNFGALAVQLPRRRQTPFVREQWVVTRVLSSPAALNDVQRSIWKKPGVDAIEFKVYPGTEQVRRSRSLLDLSQKTVRLADIGNWDQAVSDRTISYAAQAWLCTPPDDLERIVTAAKQKASADPQDSKRQQFEHAVDQFPVLTSRLHGPIRSLHQENFVNIDLIASSAVHAVREPGKTQDRASKTSPQVYAEGALLHALGIVDDPTSMVELQRTKARIMAHIVGSRVLLETFMLPVTYDHDATPPERRLQAYNQILDRLSDI